MPQETPNFTDAAVYQHSNGFVPPSGMAAVYVKSDNKLYVKDSSNVESAIGGISITNSGDNRLLTSIGTSDGINAESSLTYESSPVPKLSISGVIPNLVLNGSNGSNIALNSAETNSINSTAGLITLSAASEILLAINNGSSLSVTNSGLYYDNILVSTSGHTHVASNIIDFNSSVSGLLPTISNSGDNRLLTSTGTSTGINAENNITFDGSGLSVNGTAQFYQIFPTVSGLGNVSGTVNSNASLAQVFDMTLTGNITLANPTNPIDGVTIRWRLRQDNSGNKGLTLGNKFVIPSTATSPLPVSTSANAMDILAATYHAGRDKWDVVAFVPGY